MSFDAYELESQAQNSLLLPDLGSIIPYSLLFLIPICQQRKQKKTIKIFAHIQLYTQTPRGTHATKEGFLVHPPEADRTIRVDDDVPPILSKKCPE